MLATEVMAVQPARDDEHAGGRRQSAQRRGHREADQPPEEDTLPAEQVGERSGKQDDRAESQQVRIHHPLLCGESATQLAPDRRERDRDDAPVEEGDERRQHGDRQDRALLCAEPSGHGFRPSSRRRESPTPTLTERRTRL